MAAQRQKEGSVQTTVGLSFKPQHFQQAMDARADGLWFEVHPENYMADGGPRPRMLAALAARHPVSLHGVSLSLAGPEPLDESHLQRLRKLVAQVRPVSLSEHLAWSRLGQRYVPDLLPAPRSTGLLERVAANVDRVQQATGMRLAIENPTHYLPLDGHDYSEPAFLSELVRRTGCGLLVDINNLHISAVNIGQRASDWLAEIDVNAITEIHLAGHSEDPRLGAALLIDSHDCPVADEVLAMYAALSLRIGPRPTLIEWDGAVPDFATLLQERERVLLQSPKNKASAWTSHLTFTAAS
ncbi:MAG: DUF692 domain-containing protein [Burkholderiaceae bacterium]|nr:DUF692 domain-containing protein [Burkholderiaceae bacterium]